MGHTCTNIHTWAPHSYLITMKFLSGFPDQVYKQCEQTSLVKVAQFVAETFLSLSVNDHLAIMLMNHAHADQLHCFSLRETLDIIDRQLGLCSFCSEKYVLEYPVHNLCDFASSFRLQKVPWDVQVTTDYFSLVYSSCGFCSALFRTGKLSVWETLVYTLSSNTSRK